MAQCSLHFEDPPGDVNIEFSCIKNDDVQVIRMAWFHNPELGITVVDQTGRAVQDNQIAKLVSPLTSFATSAS